MLVLNCETYQVGILTDMAALQKQTVFPKGLSSAFRQLGRLHTSCAEAGEGSFTGSEELSIRGLDFSSLSTGLIKVKRKIKSCVRPYAPFAGGAPFRGGQRHLRKRIFGPTRGQK